MGTRVSRVILLVIVATLAASIYTANAGSALVLIPDRVLHGEVWRLVTWVFIELQPLTLIFGLVFLWFIGPDLVYAWGPGGFLIRYLAFGAATGAVTCIVSVAFPTLRAVPFIIGFWSMLDVLIIAWALMFPHRQILQYFVLPMSGRTIVYFTIGANVVFALLISLVQWLPCFIAMGLMLAYMYMPTWQYVKSRLRAGSGSKSRPRHLRPVGSPRDDKPRWLH